MNEQLNEFLDRDRINVGVGWNVYPFLFWGIIMVECSVVKSTSVFCKMPSQFILPATFDFKATGLNIEGPVYLYDLFNNISPFCFRYNFKKRNRFE